MKRLILLLLGVVLTLSLPACSAYIEPGPGYYGGGYRGPYYHPYAYNYYRRGPHYGPGPYGWAGYDAHVARYSFDAAARGMAWRGGGWRR
ncbi:MAG: hypothetical protein ACOYOL_10155 [Chthoniobacterales bacterium]|jgi:hypothetical protein